MCIRDRLLDAASAVRGAHAKAGAPAAPGAFTRTDDPAGRPRVVLYGIYDLNQAQEALVAELLGAGADLFVPIPRGGSSEGASAMEAARAAGVAQRSLEPSAASVDLERLAELWRAVLAAVAAGGAFWDCAVVVPHGDDVERTAAGLETVGIPVACRRPDRSTGPRLL